VVGSLSPLVGDAQVVGSLSPLVFPRRGVVLANSRSARSMAHDGFAPPLAHCKRDTIVNSSGVDFVVVSTRAMCSTQVSLTRLLHFFNPRQIYYTLWRMARTATGWRPLMDASSAWKNPW